MPRRPSNIPREQPELATSLDSVSSVDDIDSDEEVDVVVKFTVRYHERAHRILAEGQLAPALHFCIPLIGDMYMVIMDYVEGMPPFDHRVSGDRRQGVYNDMQRALNLLHEKNLVFGDLRAPNVIVKTGGGTMLIDFDWVGEHQVDRYPASWNNDGRWAPGVKRRGLMDKAHDAYMLENLQRDLLDEDGVLSTR